MKIQSKLAKTFLLAFSVTLSALFQFQPLVSAADSSSVAAVTQVPMSSMAQTQTVLTQPGGNETINLKGIISLYDGPAPDQLVGNLVTAALHRDAQAEALAKKDAEMKGAKGKFINGVKLTAQFMTSYRGFEMSSEAADVILDEKIRLKTDSSTEYARQKKADEVHSKVFSSVLQIGQGLGTNDPSLREKTISEGMTPLIELVGSDAATNALASLKSWSEQMAVPGSLFRQQPWSVMDIQHKSEDLLRESAQADPVMGLARRALHKFNGHSKLALGAAKVVNTTLTIAQLSPTIASPCAAMLFFVYEMANGGPEDYKLLQELYLDKRMESRWKRLNQESSQSVNAYNNAIMTHNPVLLGLSESFISGLGGEEAGSRILGSHRLVARKETHNDAIDCVQTHSTAL